MDKTAIRNFAIWARRKLISDVAYRAGLMGITADGISDKLPQSTNSVQFYDIGTSEPYKISGKEISQRSSLAALIKRKAVSSDYATAYSSIIEEVAYTWFNRLIAVRFMEVNDYLPSHIRVLSSESGKIEPDIVTNPFDAELELSEQDASKVIELKQNNDADSLFKLLFIKQCNKLSKILPRLFEKTDDYTELLFNCSYVDQEGIVYRLTHDIPKEDFDINCGGQVEIIGWLYQYYNAELKDDTFALLKKNVKITKERIPSVTQLFTPDWIVRYMVENSLGRLWTAGHTNTSYKLRGGWKYFIEEAKQEPVVQKQIDDICKEYAKLRPEDIKLIDPCMGSGHILVYAFDVLMQIYESDGYSQRDAAIRILDNNLFGIDIDDRAAQLAYFAVMMKARQDNRRILDGFHDCHVLAIHESNGINTTHSYLAPFDSLSDVALRLVKAYTDAKEYGSIQNIPLSIDEIDALENKIEEIRNNLSEDIEELVLAEYLIKTYLPLIAQARVMVQKYDVVVTNPPYRGTSDVDNKLQNYVNDNFPDSKADLSTVCMEKFIGMCKNNGMMAMINIPVWMSLSSYENLRTNFIFRTQFINIVHFGRGVFGSDFGTVAFVVGNFKMGNFMGTTFKLFDKQGSVESVEKKESRFLNTPHVYHTKQDYYEKIPGKVIAYWATQAYVDIFNNNKTLSEYALIFEGLKTRDKDRFLRAWFEVFSPKWKPYSKGGAFRRWYGNNEYVVNWGDNGEEVRAFKKSSGSNFGHYFEPTVTYNAVTMSPFTGRYIDNQLFGGGGGGITDTDYVYYLLAFVNSIVFHMFISAKKSTVNFEVGQIGEQPLVIDRKEVVEEKAQENVRLSRDDWNSFETSWDFKKHPLI